MAEGENGKDQLLDMFHQLHGMNLSTEGSTLLKCMADSIRSALEQGLLLEQVILNQRASALKRSQMLCKKSKRKSKKQKVVSSNSQNIDNSMALQSESVNPEICPCNPTLNTKQTRDHITSLGSQSQILVPIKNKWNLSASINQKEVELFQPISEINSQGRSLGNDYAPSHCLSMSTQQLNLSFNHPVEQNHPSPMKKFTTHSVFTATEGPRETMCEGTNEPTVPFQNNLLNPSKVDEKSAQSYSNISHTSVKPPVDDDCEPPHMPTPFVIKTEIISNLERSGVPEPHTFIPFNLKLNTANNSSVQPDTFNSSTKHNTKQNRDHFTSLESQSQMVMPGKNKLNVSNSTNQKKVELPQPASEKKSQERSVFENGLRLASQSYLLDPGYISITSQRQIEALNSSSYLVVNQFSPGNDISNNVAGHCPSMSTQEQQLNSSFNYSVEQNHSSPLKEVTTNSVFTTMEKARETMCEGTNPPMVHFQNNLLNPSEADKKSVQSYRNNDHTSLKPPVDDYEPPHMPTPIVIKTEIISNLDKSSVPEPQPFNLQLNDSSVQPNTWNSSTGNITELPMNSELDCTGSSHPDSHESPSSVFITAGKLANSAEVKEIFLSEALTVLSVKVINKKDHSFGIVGLMHKDDMKKALSLNKKYKVGGSPMLVREHYVERNKRNIEESDDYGTGNISKKKRQANNYPRGYIQKRSNYQARERDSNSQQTERNFPQTNNQISATERHYSEEGSFPRNRDGSRAWHRGRNNAWQRGRNRSHHQRNISHS